VILAKAWGESTVKQEKADGALEQATDLIRLMTEAALLTAGYHTHHRQWRRKRNVDCVSDIGRK